MRTSIPAARGGKCCWGGLAQRIVERHDADGRVPALEPLRVEVVGRACRHGEDAEALGGPVVRDLRESIVPSRTGRRDLGGALHVRPQSTRLVVDDRHAPALGVERKLVDDLPCS
jgi:hypothetical protein